MSGGRWGEMKCGGSAWIRPQKRRQAAALHMGETLQRGYLVDGMCVQGKMGSVSGMRGAGAIACPDDYSDRIGSALQ